MAQYSRFFITLKSDKSGYGLKGKAPSGRCILEINGKTGKISVQAQDLKTDVIYKVFVISGNDRNTLGMPVGSLIVDQKGRGEFKKEINAYDVENSGIKLEEVTVVALFVGGDKQNTPVIGYKSDEFQWRTFFKDISIEKENKEQQTKTDREGLIGDECIKQDEDIKSHENTQDNEDIKQDEDVLEVGAEKICINIDEYTVETGENSVLPKGATVEDEDYDAFEGASEIEVYDKNVLVEEIQYGCEPWLDEKMESAVNTASPWEMPVEQLDEYQHNIPWENVEERDIYDYNVNAWDTPKESEQKEIFDDMFDEDEQIEKEFEQYYGDSTEMEQNEHSYDENNGIDMDVGGVQDETVDYENDQEPTARVEDFFDDKDIEREKNIHQSFKSIVESFNKELNDLEHLKDCELEKEDNIENDVKVEQCVRETEAVNKDCVNSIQDELLFVMDNNVKIVPFKKQNKIIKWVRISLKEIALLPIDIWSYMNSSLIVSSFRQNNHLILGVEDGVIPFQYYLGVPALYENDYKNRASLLGFNQFKCCNDSRPKEGDVGYWIARM